MVDETPPDALVDEREERLTAESVDRPDPDERLTALDGTDVLRTAARNSDMELALIV